MGDGEISISPYDTAWVALVEDISGGGAPQFPASLDWISNNQLDDGSWGDRSIFSIYDRLLNTLGCVIALRSWNIHPDKTHKGVLFIKENIHKLEDENAEHMPIGYEVALPSLIEIAKKLEIDIPENTPGLQDIYARRELKLTRIPRDTMHKVPTTLLHSLEGMGGLMWEKLLKFQCADGSFLFSPSSTAFALQQTKDQNCLNYLQNCVRKFNGGVPNVYPVDLFEHIWAVDRLQRLGISRFFQPEIDECMDYVHRYWTAKGICWARNSHIVQDIDDTAMGFRLMRLHGYDISADVFKNFEKGGEFFCFAGQSTQAVTGMYNMYRASQLKFPGEQILADAADFSANFLKKKRANNDLLDKWIITKDLPGEVGYALDVPWYASLPRLEARFYLEQYGGEDDVWIGKTLYRMPTVNNNTYLELAKLDYNSCQALHQKEWKNIQKWYRSSGLEEFGSNESSLLQSYYIASASIFEPEKWEERAIWTKTAILMETIVSYFERQGVSREQKYNFVNEFERANILKYSYGRRYKTQCSLLGSLITTVNQLSLDILLARGQHIRPHLNHAWHKWLKKWEEGDMGERDVELFVRTLNFCGGGRKKSALSEEALLSHPKYVQLFKVTTRVCHQLRLFGHQKVHDSNGSTTNTMTTDEIESDMQELVKLVLTKSPTRDLDSDIKQNFLTIARSFYYASYFSPGTINFHISKVLFEKVM
ncbi:ent-copalyl diphosphate synthase chloroplastic [Phtheirospermum japonicum]|uniref:Ent-copalyl diphosphate synthase chloroplastic n=1 Tax=Phtheirospermum japonicum TaxID=374723 RepID=A0A830C5B8_9LAMI|nr:ent-copalyl diphosphate synthase chloroplastic [Phtheirospermum japonicum]